jgi:putative ATP-dependent endonuclease of OLD family
MKIKRVKIEHFRSWKCETITVDNYNCFVGANGAGKSAILCALNTFFRHTQNSPTNVLNLHEEDFYRKDTSQPIRITVTFDDLSTQAQEDLKAYYRQGELTVHTEALWDEKTRMAVGQHFGSRRIMTAFSPYFTADEEKKLAGDLKEIYKGLKQKYPDLPVAATKDAMRDALRLYEEQHHDECELAPSENQFYGWSKGANHLQKYVQWVYVPAAKDVSSEQDENKNSAFGQLLERTIRQQVNFVPQLEELKKKTGADYQKVLAGGKEALDKISQSLQTRLRTWSSPRSELQLDWLYDEQRSVMLAPPAAHAKAGEDSFLGEIARLGHGLQRSYLVALLQELAEQKGEASQPTLILGFEEPELYQHPPQAKYLRTVLEGLSANGSQVLITTHRPHMVSSQGFINVRRVTKERSVEPASRARQATYEQVAELLTKCLGGKAPSRSKALADIEQLMEPSLSELYFCDVAILVEGSEDVAHFSAHLALTDQLGWFRQHGCHFVVCRGKTNISRPLAIAQCLGIPTFTVFDSDFDDKDREADNRRDNGCLLALSGHGDQEPLSPASLVTANLAMFSPDIATVVKTEFGKDDWDKVNLKVRKEFDLGKDVKGKNAYLVAHLLEEAYKQKGPSKALESVVAAIKAFAQAAHTATATSLDTSRAPVRPDQAAQAARIQEFDNAPVPAKR